jgi:hypothetical protein
LVRRLPTQEEEEKEEKEESTLLPMLLLSLRTGEDLPPPPLLLFLGLPPGLLLSIPPPGTAPGDNGSEFLFASLVSRLALNLILSKLDRLKKLPPNKSSANPGLCRQSSLTAFKLAVN